MYHVTWRNGWWGRGALLAVALVVLAASGSFLFDRNSDGIDDGGLDLCLGPGALVHAPLFAGLVIISFLGPNALFSPASRPFPRSPPRVLRPQS